MQAARRELLEEPAGLPIELLKHPDDPTEPNVDRERVEPVAIFARGTKVVGERGIGRQAGRPKRDE